MSEDLFYFEKERSDQLSPVLAEECHVNEVNLAVDSFLFDVSWEVCRRVSGIYTVMTTKAKTTVSQWGDRYGIVGPYSEDVHQEFELVSQKSLFSDLLQIMKSKYDIVIHFGRWLVRGYPKVFLFDIDSSYNQLYHWRSELMGNFAVPDDKEANDSIVFGNQVALFFYELVQLEERSICIHFHEWMASVGLIKLKQMNVKVAKVFTGHATLLGRWLAASRVDLYGVIGSINPEEEASRLNIYHRHWIEMTAIKNADVFTTVSEIIAYEAECIFGRRPEVITPNGLVTDKFVAFHEFQNLHLFNKEKINEFVRGHFCGNLDFEIDNTLYFFTSGRREYHNKGVDLFIEALSELNYQLKAANSNITIIVFIIIPGEVNNYNVQSIKSQSIKREVRSICDRLLEKLRQRLYESLIIGNIPDIGSLVTSGDIILMKRMVQAVRQNKTTPSFITHNVKNENDEILNHFRLCNLTNNASDRVKVIYHPEFLSSNSPIFPIEYKEFVRGCHLGVFPSYYEPWGYTPAECTAMGVPSVSSDLSGFANYMARYIPSTDDHGIYIVNRRSKSFEESKFQLAEILWKFTQLSRKSRIQLRNKTETVSSILDWKRLDKYYSKARNMALKKVYNLEPSPPKT